MKKLFLLGLLSMGVVLGLTGKSPLWAESQKIKFGCVETSLAILEAMIPQLRERGYDIEPVVFDNNVNVIRVLNDGGVQASLGVHKPFMEKFNAENNGDLVMVEPYAYYGGMGLFSNKYKTVAEIPDKARIAVMSDAMNMDRALRILRDAGLITLQDRSGILTTLDVADNPKKLELIEMDQTQTVRALSELDGAVVFFSHMTNAGLDCRTALFNDRNSKNYPSAIVVKSGSENTPWAKALEEALRSEPVKKYIQEKYVGAYEFYD